MFKIKGDWVQHSQEIDIVKHVNQNQTDLTIRNWGTNWNKNLTYYLVCTLTYIDQWQTLVWTAINYVQSKA